MARIAVGWTSSAVRCTILRKEGASQQVHSKSTRNSFTQTPVVLLTTGRGRIFTVEHMKQITVERSLRANLGPGPSVKNAALTANLHLRWTANTSVAIEGVVIYSTGGILFA